MPAAFVTRPDRAPARSLASRQTAIRSPALAGKREAWSRVSPETLGRTRKSGRPRDVVVGARQKTYPPKLRENRAAADPRHRTYLAKFSLLRPATRVSLACTATLTLCDGASQRGWAAAAWSALFKRRRQAVLYVV